MEIEQYEEIVLRTQNQVNSLTAMLENATVTQEDFWNFMASIERGLEKRPPSNLRYYQMVLDQLESCQNVLKAIKENPTPSNAVMNLKIIDKSLEKILDLIEIE